MEPSGIQESECQRTLTKRQWTYLEEKYYLSLVLVNAFQNAQLLQFSSAIHKMNQVHDGSFSDALHTTLLLKDPLRDWCERNVIGQTAISFFIWEKACKEGHILSWTSPRLPEQGGSEFMLQRQHQMSTWNLAAEFQNSSAWSPVAAWWEGLVRFSQCPV